VTERPANCPHLTISFAMRAPEWGPPATDLYAAALDMTAWAERVGFDEVRLSEHHDTTDGYLPSPIVLAAGLGARTSTIAIKLFVVLATLQHPITSPRTSPSPTWSRVGASTSRWAPGTARTSSCCSASTGSDARR